MSESYFHVIFQQVIIPALIILASYILGLLLNKIIHSRFTSLAKRTKWRGDDIIVESIRKMPIFWFVLAGMYFSLFWIPINESSRKVVRVALLILAIWSVIVVSARFVEGLINLYTGDAQKRVPRTSILTNISKIIVYVIGVLIILQTLGISITPIITALGIGGLAVALALQDTLTNLFSGIYVILSRQIRPGDYVRLDEGIEGTIADITWRNTTIQQLSNNLVIIPNAKLASAVVVNFFLPQKDLSVSVELSVSYDSNLEKVEKVTVDVAKEVMREVQGGVPTFEPGIRFHTFADTGIKFNVNLRAQQFTDQYLIKHEFIKRIQKKYKEEGIEIPYPMRTIYLSQENNS